MLCQLKAMPILISRKVLNVYAIKTAKQKFRRNNAMQGEICVHLYDVIHSDKPTVKQ